MHSPKPAPAGKALELQELSDGHHVRAHILEPTAVKLCEHGVYTAFPVGIVKPDVRQDRLANGGRIVDGRIVEVSMVDAPANPNCRFTIAKAAANGSPTYVGKVYQYRSAELPYTNFIVRDATQAERIEAMHEQFAAPPTKPITNRRTGREPADALNRVQEGPRGRAGASAASLALRAPGWSHVALLARNCAGPSTYWYRCASSPAMGQGS